LESHFRRRRLVAESAHELRHVRPSVLMYQLGCHWKIFQWNLLLVTFMKTAREKKNVV